MVPREIRDDRGRDRKPLQGPRDPVVVVGDVPRHEHDVGAPPVDLDGELDHRLAILRIVGV